MSCSVTICVLETDALTKLKKILTTDIPQEIKLDYVSSPNYRLTVSSCNKQISEKLLLDTVKIIENNCNKFGGKYLGCTENVIVKEKTYTFSRLNDNTYVSEQEY